MTKLFLLLSSFLINTSAYSQVLNTEKLDSFFNALETNNKAMGSFAIAKNGKIIYRRSIGYSKFTETEKIKADENTVYRIGSTSKMFTATIILQLIEEGRLTLETELDKYYSQIPNAKKITIETLLNHRSGLYDFVNDNEDDIWLTKPQNRTTILEEISKGKTHFEPNSKFSYNNSGYYILTCIIEKVLNQTYTDVLKERITSKIGIKNTFSPISNKPHSKEALPYNFINKWTAINDFYFPNVSGVGDILSTPSDLIVFETALFNGQFISQKSLALMKTFKNPSFGMGIMKVPFYSHIGYGHGGDTYGTHSIVAQFPSDSLAIAYSINGEVLPHNDIAIGLLSICFNYKYEIPTFRKIEVSDEILSKYLGLYSNPALPLKITITKNGKTLLAQATGQSAFPLEATEKDKFKFDEAGVEIEFNTDKNEFTMNQGGGAYKFKKIK